MASSTYHTILIRANNEIARREALSGEADILPGHLLEMSAGTVVTHNTASGFLPLKMIALESQTPDDDDNWSVDAPYASGDTVYYAVAKPGERYYMWLAAGQTVVAGVTPLGSDGAGCVTAISVTTSTLDGAVLGVPAEAKVTTGAKARLMVDIL